jgi:hypothetical protein
MPNNYNRRALYWSGPLAVFWIGILEELDQLLQQSWQCRALEGDATRRLWFGVVAVYFLVLALAALALHLAFLFKRPREERSLTTVFSLLLYLLLCGALLATSMVLRGPGVSAKLKEFKLDFLGRFLFYLAVVWSLMKVLESLFPPDPGN